MKKIKIDLALGFFFLILSIFYYIGSYSIKAYAGYGGQAIDSKFMPRVLAVLLFILSILMIAASYKKYRSFHKDGEKHGGEELKAEEFDEEANVRNSNWRAFCVIAVLLILYVAAFKPIGFVISSSAFLFLAILYLTPGKQRNWFLTVALSIVIPIAVYYLFVKGFKLKLPAGILNI